MSLDNLIGAHMVEPDSDQAGAPAPAGKAQDGLATKGAGLGDLMGALLGGAGLAAGHAGAMDPGGLLGGLLGGGGGAGEINLGSLLGGLLGGAGPAAGEGLDVNGLAEESGVSQSVIQAAIPLVLGALTQGMRQRTAGVELDATRGAAASGSHHAGLADLVGALISGKPLGPQLLEATGLPQQLSHNTGVGVPEAVTTIQNILKALHIGPVSSGSKPKGKPKQSSGGASSRPRPKPKPSGARPKPAASRPQAKPKTTGSSRPKTGAGGGRGGRKG